MYYAKAYRLGDKWQVEVDGFPGLLLANRVEGVERVARDHIARALVDGLSKRREKMATCGGFAHQQRLRARRIIRGERAGGFEGMRAQRVERERATCGGGQDDAHPE